MSTLMQSLAQIHGYLLLFDQPHASSGLPAGSPEDLPTFVANGASVEAV